MPATAADDASHLLPRSLPAYVPLIWKHALFPGTAPVDQRVRILPALLVVILPALLLYPCISFQLLEPDEGRYAEIPREMLLRGDWGVPYLQGKPYLDKPPLMYWLVMVSYSIFGVHDWAARLAPALAVHLTILAVYFLGRRSLGERAARWGAFLLMVAPAFMGMGRLLILDGLLACCTTIATLAAFEAIRKDRLQWGWWLLAAFACGCGVLTKGPVAVILVLPPIWLYQMMQAKSARVGVLGWATLAATALAVNLPWYTAIGWRAPEFLRHFFWEHNIKRFFQPFDHIRPFWFYAPIVLAGLLPGTLLLVGFLRFLFSSDAARSRFRSPEFGFIAISGGWGVLFFSMSGCKLPTYILPALPLLALALGTYVAARWQGPTRLPTVLVCVLFLFMTGLHYFGMPWYAKQRSPMGEPERVARYCADPKQPVICFPRSCDSVAFYLQRDDFRVARSKNYFEIVEMLRENPRTVVLFTHRHSLDALKFSLPPDLKIVEVTTFKRDKEVGAWFDVLTTETPWGLCDLAVVEKQ